MTPLGEQLRGDLRLIGDLVEPGARILDVGCGDGDLLYHLTHNKGIDGRGIELSRTGVNACLARGLSVVQGDADTDLAFYPSAAFDYVILSQTLQATRHPREVLGHLLRIGRRAVVSFPNFGYWRVRAGLAFGGRMPMTKTLNVPWYDTPNIHFCTIKDFVALCHDLGIGIDKSFATDRNGRPQPWSGSLAVSNLLGAQAVFLLKGPQA